MCIISSYQLCHIYFAIMPSSRKRSKGKARKDRQRVANCRHGCPPAPSDGEHIINRFMETFCDSFHVTLRELPTVQTGIHAVDTTFKHFRQVWDDKALRDYATAGIVSFGTKLVLGGNWDEAARIAGGVILMEQYDPTEHVGDNANKTPFTLGRTNKEWMHHYDLMTAHCGRTLVEFYYERVPCNCLQKMYDKVKSKPKLARCCYCGAEKARTAMLICTGCSCTQYCGKECQVGDWARHKDVCKRLGGK